MRSDQWMNLWNETAAACDWNQYLKTVEQWSHQGMDWWKEMQSVVQSSTTPHLWIDTARAVADAWDAAINDWGSISSPEEREADKKAIERLEKARDAAQAELAAKKQELTKVKRSLAQKTRSLNQHKETVARQRSDLAEKKRQIAALEKKLAEQAERLRRLETAAGGKVSSSAPAGPRTPVATQQP